MFPITDAIGGILRLLCSETTYFVKLCLHFISAIGSHDSKLVTQETATLIFSIRPATVSARQVFHYMQNIKTGIFGQYDYGEAENLRRYKTKTPPEYNLSNVVSPVAMFYGEKDDYISLTGIEESIEVLPNVILSYKVPYKRFNHIDYLFAYNASRLVYKRTVQLFKDFDDGKIQNGEIVEN